jgi:predicted enzyme related to lactoylglutathione lyase
MAATIGAIVIDAIDVDRVAAFWASLLGWEYGKDDDGDVVVADPARQAGFTLLVLAVPEKKTLKNRVHIDLDPTGVGQRDQSWIVLADPEGNEFCLLARRGDAGEASADAK